jgi:tetratricopeptide (TPR) repeat protein/mono/diheme cytochrome c family protein
MTRPLSWWCAALAVMAAAGCRRAPVPASTQTPGAGPVTFNKDIAPIVFHNCAPCHRPGEAGPFSLLDYAAVRRRARDIVRVTGSRYMPPWPPDPGYGEFEGERRLSDEQIALIQRWVGEGAPEGDPAQRPAAPQFAAGWQLGPPDLVLEAAEPFTVPATGTDVFRNLVVPVPLTAARWVRALELRPGNKAVVHHANVLLDRTGSARRLDASDPGPGFGGMDVELESDSFEPDSHFLFWKPGTAAVSEPADMAWRVDGQTDLVLNLHLQPSGKPEVIRPVVGLYFTDTAPTRHPMLVQLEDDGAIDIPPGRRDFVVEDHYELPVDVDVLGVYPHAHYLGRKIEAFATLPDGSRTWLLRIGDWDFNWQAVYRFRRPVPLPRGATVHMRVTYDNSADNPRNPSDPPRRVRAGNRSSDEMGHLWLQLLPRDQDQRWLLQEASMRRRLEKYPGDFVAHANLGAVLEARGRPREAVEQYQQALRARPDSAPVLNNLGALMQAKGEGGQALRLYRAAVRAQPDYVNARYNLGNALAARGSFEEALAQFREAVRLRPADLGAQANLGAALLATGRIDEAVTVLRRVVAADPGSLNAQFNLGRALAARGRLAEAAEHFEQAVRIDPADPLARQSLSEARARLRRSP